MEKKEFKEARTRLGLTQKQLAHILNVHPRTIPKWEYDDGTRPINPTAVRVMSWLLSGWRPPEWPQK
jgi:DNA-binding XRE family transcriptional regulator